MIYWLVQSSIEQLKLKRGLELPWFLAKQEQEQYARLRTEKRRHDWLLGRWTSKLLTQAMLQEEVDASPDLDDLVVAYSADGAPFVSCSPGKGQPQITLSISHSGERAFCAAVGVLASSRIPFGLLGADIERVEARPPGFAQEYFTEMEKALIERTPVQSRDLLVTATWSAKEAALKALHLGLTVDTRSVTCLVEPLVDDPEEWASFPIEWDVRRLNRYTLQQPAPPNLVGWWRVQEGYVLTLAAEPSVPPQATAVKPLQTAGNQLLTE